MNPGRVSPSVALAAYAEAWISGAKVVVFGDALSPLAERLVERGARHVQVYDADAARAAEASAASTLKQVAHGPLDLAGSSLRDGFFDVAIVEDLSGARRTPKDLLTLLVRALSRRGLALIGSRNPDVAQRLIARGPESEQALSYYDLYDMVSQHFEEVRMLGQTPFVGYAIADFSAADASDVRIDTALLPGGAEEPEWFLALASALPVSPDAFSVIQLPLSELDLGRGHEPAESDLATSELADGKIRELEAALAELAAEGAREAEKHAAERAQDAERFAAERARDAEKLIAERHATERAREAEKLAVERAREAERLATERAREAERLAAERIKEAEKLTAERSRDAEKQAAERSRAGEKHERSRDAERRELEKTLGQKIQALEAELEKREEWLVGLESRAATADERADEAQAELEQLGKDQRKAKEQIARLEQQLEEERRAKRQLEELGRTHKQELDKRDRRVEAEAQRLNELTNEAKVLGARVAELTQALAQSEQKAKQSELRAKQSEQKAKQSAESGDEEVQAELLALEALLKDRAAEVSRLAAALHETERFGRQLILQVTELGTTRAAAPESPDAVELTRRNAQLAADLEAARWTISSLEGSVGGSPTAAPSPGQRREEIPPVEPLA